MTGDDYRIGCDILEDEGLCTVALRVAIGRLLSIAPRVGNGNGYGDGHGYGYGDGYGNGYGDSDGNGYGDSDGNGYGDGYGYGDGSGNGYGGQA